MNPNAIEPGARFFSAHFWRNNMKNAKIIAASYENGSYPYVTGEAELPEIKGA